MNIGRYEIIQELGQGGMATVYLARDPYIKRQVAIKVLPRQFTFDPQFRARFQQEAEVIAALEHPAIVPVYDFGEEDEQPFIVMRYMSGGTLADQLTKGPLPISEIATLFERIGSALDHAHRLGIIHRDIKPGNILFDAQHISYLSDFGISKITEATASITGTGIIGTPAYMSPEQAQGEKNIDGRCDIYSLGVVLFQALTGELPYNADTPMGQAMAHVIQPVPNLLERRPNLPPVFATIIHKTLDKYPANRYQTASELTQAIREVDKPSGIRVTPMPAEVKTIEPANTPSIKLDDEPVPPQPKPAPIKITDSSPIYPPVAAQQKTQTALPRLAGALIFLLVCLGIALLGGLASGLIPNPLAIAPIQSITPLPSAINPTLLLASPTLNEVTQTNLPEASPTTLTTASATPLLETTPTQTETTLPASFTAKTNMLCRDGPGTEYADHWQLNAGEIVQVLAQWGANSDWLLVDINVPATQTRTDCCWVGGEGELNVSLDQIKTINFLPDRLDCSPVR